MLDAKISILVVEEEPLLRTSFSLVFQQLGYDVRSAEDGFSALSELRKKIPDILLSDLNMPGMSGFELLSVVRRRFPSIRVIAMSGAFCARELPWGVAADAFYQKGRGVDRLLRSIKDVLEMKRLTRAEAPIWISQGGHGSSEEPSVTIACPECLRAFPARPARSMGPISETNCAYCSTSIRYALATARCA